MWTITLNEFFLFIGALAVLIAAILIVILRGSEFSKPIPGPKRPYRMAPAPHIPPGLDRPEEVYKCEYCGLERDNEFEVSEHKCPGSNLEKLAKEAEYAGPLSEGDDDIIAEAEGIIVGYVGTKGIFVADGYEAEIYRVQGKQVVKFKRKFSLKDAL